MSNDGRHYDNLIAMILKTTPDSTRDVICHETLCHSKPTELLYVGTATLPNHFLYSRSTTHYGRQVHPEDHGRP